MWVRTSSLSDDGKGELIRFIGRFRALTFFKEDDPLLDHLEEVDRVKLPPWFRTVRKTLAFVDPPMQVRFDDYDHVLPGSDDVEDAWYVFDLGYGDDEQRRLFHDEAGCYPIGDWRATGYSSLAIGMLDERDERILEFTRQDLLDNVLNGKPARASVRCAFDSYPRMLAHIVQGRLPGGVLIAQS